jgi:prepilin-type N-terminal cleavage/methylation domain-containing protein
LRKTAIRHRLIPGFTLIEVMMAATILTVGFMGLIKAVTITSGMMDEARRQTLAAQILNHEIEKLRFLPWDDPLSTNDIVGLPAGPSTIAIASQFDSARTSLSDDLTASAQVSFSATRSVADIATNLREVTVTVTWIVKSSRRDYSGNPVTFTYTRVNSAYFGKYGLNLTYQRS